MKRAPYAAIHEAHAAGWDLVNDSQPGEVPVYVVSHPANPGEGRDRPRIFESCYMEQAAGWRAITRYVRKHGLDLGAANG